jgi:hypothetical protein
MFILQQNRRIREQNRFFPEVGGGGGSNNVYTCNNDKIK